MKSDSIKELASALSKAQGEIKNAKKDAKNSFFKNSYCTLESVREVVNPVFFKYGIAVVQFPCDPAHSLKTVLIHESGEYMEEVMAVSPVKVYDKDKEGKPFGEPYVTPQALGSAITYARRYALMGVAGIAPEDDDGESAMGRSTKPAKEEEVQPPTAKTWKNFTCHLGKPGGTAKGVELGQMDLATMQEVFGHLENMKNRNGLDNALFAALTLGLMERKKDNIPME